MTLEEMAQRQQSTRSSENSTQEKSTDILTKLNEENKHLSEQNKQTAARVTELTEKNASLITKIENLKKTIDQKEDTIRAMNAKLMFPSRPKVEYRVEKELFKRCIRCDIDDVKSKLRAAKDNMQFVTVFTVVFMLLAAIKNNYIRRDICALAVSFSNLVCKCAAKLDLAFTKAAEIADKIENQTAAQICGGLIYIVLLILFLAVFIGVLWLLSYALVYMVKEYWKSIHSGIAVFIAAIMIIAFDTPLVTECEVSTILIYFIFTAIMIGLYELLERA